MSLDTKLAGWTMKAGVFGIKREVCLCILFLVKAAELTGVEQPEPDAVLGELRFVSGRLLSSGDVLSPSVMHLKGLAGGPHKPDPPDPCAAEISCEGGTGDQPCDQSQQNTPPTSSCPC